MKIIGWVDRMTKQKCYTIAYNFEIFTRLIGATEMSISDVDLMTDTMRNLFNG